MLNGLFVLVSMFASRADADTSFRLSRDMRVSVDAEACDVQVKTTNIDIITISGGDVSRSGKEVSIECSKSLGEGRPLVITLPNWVKLEISSAAGDVTIDGPSQELDVEAAAGNVQLRRGAGEAALNSIAGNISVSDFAGTSLAIDALGGDITVRNATGVLSATGVSGNITLQGVKGSAVSAETVNGDIVLSGTYAAKGTYSLETHNGDVTVELGDNPSARIQTSTFKGDVSSAFDRDRNAPIRTTDRGGRSNLGQRTFTFGSGGPTFSLTTFNGDIRIRMQ